MLPLSQQQKQKKGEQSYPNFVVAILVNGFKKGNIQPKTESLKRKKIYTTYFKQKIGGTRVFSQKEYTWLNSYVKDKRAKVVQYINITINFRKHTDHPKAGRKKLNTSDLKINTTLKVNTILTWVK